ncbi:hypothetical protein [Metapseudomonas otitidis]|uniref:hypothetical protein n=1 Tax=Metapseudomonas otitidis TaxID=319939 RepID=UPI0013F600AA|nr:hypothetical protein [Pseudomonas otitidis]
MNKAVHPQQARPALRLLCILTPTPYGQWRPVPAATHRPRAPRADIRGRWGYVLPEELYMREVWISTPRVSWRRLVAQDGAFGAEVS